MNLVSTLPEEVVGPDMESAGTATGIVTSEPDRFETQ